MTNQPPEEKKNVHILVPRGFQRGELLRPDKGISHDANDTPHHGQCMKCKGTGAIPHKVWLSDYKVVDGRIVTAQVNMAWVKCKCYMGQKWVKFHPLNVQAILIPKWEKELNDMKEREKMHIIRESGGNYDSHQDTFLKDLEYKPPVLSKEAKSLKDMNFGGIIHK